MHALLWTDKTISAPAREALMTLYQISRGKGDTAG